MRQRRTHHKLRPAAGIAFLACLSISLAACASSSGSSAQSSGSAGKSPIVIGFTGDLSGETAFLDQPYLAGVRTRFRQINDAGGVDGHPLTLDVVDQTDNLAQAQASFRQLASSQAVAVLGGGIQTNAFTFVPIADQAHLTMTYYGSTPQLVANPYFFGTETPSDRLGTAQATFLVDMLKAKGITSPRIAILGFEAPWFTTAKSVLAKLGAKLVADQEPPLSSPDTTAGAVAVAAAKPDGVILGVLDNYLPATVSTLRSHGFTGPMVNTPSTGYKALTSVNDPNVYTTSEAVPVEFANYPGMTALRSAAAAAGQTANMTGPFFTNGYMDGLLFAKALEKCGASCTREQFPAALAQTQVTSADTDGLSSPRGPSGRDHQLMTGLAIGHIVDGEFKYVVGFQSWGVAT